MNIIAIFPSSCIRENRNLTTVVRDPRNIDREKADEIKAQLEAVGAQVEII